MSQPYGANKACLVRLTRENALLVAGFKRAEILRGSARYIRLLLSRRRLPCGLHLLTRVR